MWRSRQACIGPYHSAIAFVHVDFVAQDHEGEVVRILRTSLDEELIAPVVEVLEGLCIIHVVDEHTAVCTAIKGDAETLETLLARCVPDLCTVSARQ